jgi:hypothetical protein
LHADADAQDGTAAGEASSDDLATADRRQACHARGEGADAGHDQPVGLLRVMRIGADDGVRAGRSERALGRAQVARAMIEYDDTRRGHGTRVRECDLLPLAPGGRAE